jgi:hypothetical protein
MMDARGNVYFLVVLVVMVAAAVAVHYVLELVVVWRNITK